MVKYRPVGKTGVVMLALLALAGCGEKLSPPYTLYRDSNFDARMRIHFATFNAHETEPAPGGGSFNQENCQMTAGLLNENVARLNNDRHPVRFWCEKGPFRP